jgi:hypothetical protein
MPLPESQSPLQASGLDWISPLGQLCLGMKTDSGHPSREEGVHQALTILTVIFWPSLGDKCCQEACTSQSLAKEPSGLVGLSPTFATAWFWSWSVISCSDQFSALALLQGQVHNFHQFHGHQGSFIQASGRCEDFVVLLWV